jgi:hypothetical protein
MITLTERNTLVKLAARADVSLWLITSEDKKQSSRLRSI